MLITNINGTTFSEAIAQGAQLPLCVSNQHVHGRWIGSASYPWEKAYVCCGEFDTENKKTPECKESLLVAEGDFGNNNVSLQAAGHACHCDNALGAHTVHNREKYIWFPYDCQLMNFDAKRFCALLGGQEVYLAGDSTVREQFISLNAQVRAGNGGCANQLRYVGVYDRPQFAKTMLATNGSTILVVNWGAHWDVNYASGSDINSFLAFLDADILQKLTVAQRGMLSLVWRTNHAGHYRCPNALKPESHAEQIANGRYTDVYPYLFRYEELIGVMNMNATKRAMEWGGTVMDMAPLHDRPDAHVGSFGLENTQWRMDCLHSCQPGPVDIGANIFLQMLTNNEIKPLSQRDVTDIVISTA